MTAQLRYTVTTSPTDDHCPFCGGDVERRGTRVRVDPRGVCFPAPVAAVVCSDCGRTFAVPEVWAAPYAFGARSLQTLSVTQHAPPRKTARASLPAKFLSGSPLTRLTPLFKKVRSSRRLNRAGTEPSQDSDREPFQPQEKLRSGAHPRPKSVDDQNTQTA